MRQLELHRNVAKDLARLPAKQYRQVVTSIFDLLAEPLPHNSRQLKDSQYHRLAVGEYRVVYRFTDSLVKVAVFGKRNDDSVYRVLQHIE